MPTPVYGSNTFTNIPDVNGTPVLLNGGGTGQIASGVYASRPAAGNAGDLYVDTTNDIIWRDTGSAWTPMNKVLNIYSTTVAATSGAATLAFSNTAPTSTSGIQIASLTLTPISSSSQFLIMSSVSLSSTTANSNQFLMAFRGTTLLGMAASTFSTASNISTSSLKVIDSPATASSITFTLRSATTAGTLFINSRSGNTTLFGSSLVNNGLIILEVQP